MALPRSGLLGLSVLAVVLAASSGVLLWQAVELSSVAQVAARVDELKPFATGIRLALIGLVTALWPWLIGLANRYPGLPTAAVALNLASVGEVIYLAWRTNQLLPQIFALNLGSWQQELEVGD